MTQFDTPKSPEEEQANFEYGLLTKYPSIFRDREVIEEYRRVLLGPAYHLEGLSKNLDKSLKVEEQNRRPYPRMVVENLLRKAVGNRNEIDPNFSHSRFLSPDHQKAIERSITGMFDHITEHLPDFTVRKLFYKLGIEVPKDY